MPFLVTSRTRSRVRVRRVLALTGLTCASVVLGAFVLYASTGVLGENVHEVVAGELYRSAQLSTERLDGLIDGHRIQSVLSLRKADPPAPEFARETHHLSKRGISHLNVPMSPTKLPKPEALDAILERFDSGPYPLLIHCEEGADRTGLATVLWLVVKEGVALDEAITSHLSWKTGHFALGQTHAMDDFFELYVRTNGGASLRDWIASTYPDLYRRRTGSAPPSNAVYAHDR